MVLSQRSQHALRSFFQPRAEKKGLPLVNPEESAFYFCGRAQLHSPFSVQTSHLIEIVFITNIYVKPVQQPM